MAHHLNLLLLHLLCLICASQAKLVNFGSKLTQHIEQHPDKSWLIKFYVPWCYHCQQLEPVFQNVAEQIYQKHPNLIVGRVDCTKFGQVCDEYQVKSYPKIAYLNKSTQIAYTGDRSAKSMIEFAERLTGPDIHSLSNCNELLELSWAKELIVLFTLNRESTPERLYQVYKSIASRQKSRFWFYELPSSLNCKNLQLLDNNIYLIKRDLDKAIKFEKNQNEESNEVELAEAILSWIGRNSIPVCGPVGSGNLDRYLSSQKSLVLAVLEGYQPERGSSKPSQEFHNLFRKVVKKFAKRDDHQLIFGWTSDSDLVSGIKIGQVLSPNVMIIRPNYTYHLVINNQEEVDDKIGETQVPKKLGEHNLELLLAKMDQLEFAGGNSYLLALLRQIYIQFNIYANMYRANPILATILVGLPSMILVFVIYTTCCYEGELDDGDDECKQEATSSCDDDYDDDDFDEEEIEELGYGQVDDVHLKQD